MVFKPKLTQQEIAKLAQDYRIVLEQAGYPVSRLVLFGSYTKGDVHDWSDIDFLVVSPEFEKKDDFNELAKMNIIAAQISPLIEAHIASEQEYQTADSPWLAEVKKYGREYPLA
ncbi:MAG: nucleotidyltransferase domain-containing protein [Patescibacteria group bacterium]